MKDLLEKVRTLEAQQAEVVPSSRALDIAEGKKRKYQYAEDSEHETSDVYDGRQQHKRHRGDAHERRPRSSISEILSAPSVGSSAVHEISEQPSRAIAASRLPSISSWLNTVTTAPLDSPVVMATSPSFRATPDSYIDPQLRSSGRNTKPPESAVRHHSMTPTEHHSSYLPSPPPSTRIPPMTHGAMGPSDLPSTLHLGEAYNVDPSSPSAKDVRSSMGSRAGGPRTPDEDSAASMLLEISASLSPQTYPSSSSPNARSTVPSTSAERMSLSPPSLRLGASCVDVSIDEGGDEKHLTPPRLGPSVPVVQSTSNVRPIVRPCIATRTVDLGTSVPLVPQTPSSLLGMGGVERVMSRLGLGARVVGE
ncbi:hypothetical protein ONZ45_g19651 [Pleurotus djamor]|nr:hypothetical protein ONZ45_g19651 [Pleurotus djamor]